MPYELGGRADKSGNRFEIKWVIYQMLKVLDERLDYVVLEALGDDEKGIDIWPSYNIDRDWASEIILKLYEQDFRLAGFYDTKNMLFLLYSKYRKRILKIIKSCYESDDEELIKMGAYCISEMYILKNEFALEMNNVDFMSRTQAEAILHIAIIYFKKDDYNSLAKKI